MYSETCLNRSCSKAETLPFVNFLKKKHFFTLQINIFLISICSFEVAQRFCLKLAIFYSKLLLQPTNNCFCATESVSTFKSYDTPLCTIDFSTVTYVKLWWSVKDLQKNALKIYGTDSTTDILTSDKNLVFFQFYFPFFNWHSK